MKLFTATGKLKVFFPPQLEIFDVCTTGETAHIDMIFKFLPHTRQHGCIYILHCWMIRAFRSARSRGNVGTNTSAYFARNARCTVTNRLTRVIFQHTKRLLPNGAAIFSLHALASPSGRNVNYDEKQFTGEKKWSCSFYLHRFRKYVIRVSYNKIFVIPEYIMKRPVQLNMYKVYINMPEEKWNTPLIQASNIYTDIPVSQET
jgi:hypothetical protein